MSSMLITPAQVNALSGQRIMLIDIRGQDEWRREHLAGARALPLEQIQPGCFDKDELAQTDMVIFHCQSGMRTEKAQQQLTAAAHPANVRIMQGGLNAWKAAGLPVITDRRQPLPLMRQVQIVAGALALGGTLAGATMTPAFYIVPGFVGAGLMFAGITGWCGMAKLLAVMPWHK
ncbi:rhodanese family protein [Cronobacter malonaticus]|uniref:rhodanese-like domain-containing protein n=1 Tax=Cronobacter malonaticus TaxID=413503 RepID=UPI000CFF9904|nr:rhodanese family protein [Cronobacter malonaticus]MEB8681287.1 rhodanese family protein [Cronobacter malonaticus]